MLSYRRASVATSMPRFLRTGKIVNTYEGLDSREKPGITERTVRARAGAGGRVSSSSQSAMER